MNDDDAWFFTGCVLGLCAVSLAQAYLYRNLRTRVEFLTVLAEKRMTDV
jgi:hypothetical protein